MNDEREQAATGLCDADGCKLSNNQSIAPESRYDYDPFRPSLADDYSITLPIVKKRSLNNICRYRFCIEIP